MRLKSCKGAELKAEPLRVWSAKARVDDKSEDARISLADPSPR
jgi:hypothetical protein